MRSLAVPALLLLLGVALVAPYAKPVLVNAWVDWHLERAQRRFAAEDYEGALADAEVVMARRPGDKAAGLLYWETLICVLKRKFAAWPPPEGGR